MKQSARVTHKTFQIQLPFGKALIVAVLWLTLFIGLSESISRIPDVQGKLPAPSVSSNVRFDLRLLHLENFVAKHGKVDCLFIGTSTVGRGLDPAVFGSLIKEEAGTEVKCFNFGVARLYVSTAIDVAQILVNRYHPRLLIFGADPTSIFHDADNGVEHTSWLYYGLGGFSIKGWAADSLYSYRYWLTTQHLRDSSYATTASEIRYTVREDGFYTPATQPAGSGVTTDVHAELNPAWRIYFSAWDTVSHELQILNHWQRFEEQGIRVIIAEMPLHSSARGYFANGEPDYQTIRVSLNNAIEETHIPYWRLEAQPAIPDSGWNDRIHLNYYGAALLSSHFGNWINKNKILLP